MKANILTAQPTWYDGIALVRIIVGYMFFKHGLQIFDEDAMKGYVDWSADLGFKPGSFWAYAGKLIELVGGLFLMLGLFTRIVSIPMTISMAIITFMFHKGQPFDGDEHPFMMMLFAFLFFLAGPGRWSLDQLFFKKRSSVSATNGNE